jgi:uncharacterized protein (DUF488 family)
VDVRAYPVSRRHPQFTRQSLEATLQAAFISYEWHGKALGGYRELPYTEHMKTLSFRQAAAALAGRSGQVCIMCAESNPDDCHRQHIAEWLAAHGHRVVHLLSSGRAREHVRHPQETLWPDG